MMNGKASSTGVSTESFEYTPVEEIPKIAARARQTFQSNKTRDLEFRKKQLRKLYWAIHDHEAEYVEASKKDMSKPTFEVVQGETIFQRNDILYVLKHLDAWAKDEKDSSLPVTLFALSVKTRKDPLGACLLIGPFNYPMICTISPLIGAIAAGNTAVVKFSERIPTISTVLRKIVESALDPDCYSVVQGGIPETTALLAEPWGKIFFTGSETVAKVVARAAAVHLTPITLELGGRNPAIVTKSADIRIAARRLLWGKTINAGQACVSENYVLVDQSVLPKLISELKSVYAEFFPDGGKSSDNPNLAHLVPGAVPRVKSLLDSSSSEIILGGHTDEANNYLAPTVLLASSPNDPIIVNETFAPITTLLPYTDLPSALATIPSVHSTPLAVYPFTRSASDLKTIIDSTLSGGVTINDTIMHGGLPTLEFGGVGDSGSGSYRGKASFDCFTHRRTILNVPNWMDGLLAARYPPYTSQKLASYRKIGEGRGVDFDRQGNRKFSLMNWIFGPSVVGNKVTGSIFLATLALIVGIVLGNRSQSFSFAQLQK